MTTQHISWNEIQIERLDDIPLLIGLQQRLEFDAIIDDVIPRPYQGLSLGNWLWAGMPTFCQKPTTARWLLNGGASIIKRCCQNCLAHPSVAPISVMTD